jgi:hypothetical protein
MSSTTTPGKGDPPMHSINDVMAAQRAIEKLIGELSANNATASDT